MALASLVSFQKQKLTVVNFHEIRYRKSGFQRGNKRTFFMPLVDTRSLIQYKTNIITYGKKNMTQYWHMQMHPDDQSFSEVLHSILENKKL